jgi:sRNA-binding regulator protein Hfq
MMASIKTIADQFDLAMKVTSSTDPRLTLKERSHGAHESYIDPSLFNEARGKRPSQLRGGPKQTSPPDQTNAEKFYYLKQMQSKTSMSIVLRDGEVLKGVIEWYDKDCLKVNREDAPNLLLFKSNIKYMHKA